MRTIAQQAWAAASEAVDRQYEGFKYGKGPIEAHKVLETWSARLAEFELSGDLTVELMRDSDALTDRLEAMLETL
jgi:hypothetical protein